MFRLESLYYVRLTESSRNLIRSFDLFGSVSDETSRVRLLKIRRLTLTQVSVDNIKAEEDLFLDRYKLLSLGAFLYSLCSLHDTMKRANFRLLTAAEMDDANREGTSIVIAKERSLFK